MALQTNTAGVKQLTFGIRPENITLTPMDSSIAVPGTVVLTEPLGAETLVTWRIGAAEMVARCAASFNRKPGEQMPVYLAADKMHLFNADTGFTLR